MPEQKPTLDYGRPIRRYSLSGLASVLSIVFGMAVTITSLCCYWATIRPGEVSSAIFLRVYDEHWALFLPPLAIIGFVAGIISWNKRRSIASLFGIVLSGIAFAASMVPTAIDRLLYFPKH